MRLKTLFGCILLLTGIASGCGDDDGSTEAMSVFLLENLREESIYLQNNAFGLSDSKGEFLIELPCGACECPEAGGPCVQPLVICDPAPSFVTEVAANADLPSYLGQWDGWGFRKISNKQCYSRYVPDQSELRIGVTYGTRFHTEDSAPGVTEELLDDPQQIEETFEYGTGTVFIGIE